MPRSGDTYSLPAGTAAVSGATANSSHVNERFADLEAEQNLARPISAGGTGAASPSGARAAMGVEIGVDVQAYDADLAAIAALASAANKMLYATGAGTWSMADFTAFARSLLDDADAATALATLGAQPADAALTSLAGLSLAAGDLLYATAADTLVRLPKGTAGQLLSMNAGAGAPEWVDRPGWTWLSTVNVTSGSTAQTIASGLPANISEVYIRFRGVSLNGAGSILVQFGTSGGLVTAGYHGGGGGSGGVTSSTSGFVLYLNGAAQTTSGNMRAIRVSPHVWSEQANNAEMTGLNFMVSSIGEVNLAAELTQIAVIPSSGSFDATGVGEWQVGYRM